MKIPHWLRCRWSKWEAYTYAGVIRGYGPDRLTGAPAVVFTKDLHITERRQKRHCLECGKEEDRKVRHG